MTDPTPQGPKPRKRSLVDLITALPDQVQELVQREIELVKTELTEKVKALGTGGGLILGAVVTLLFFIGVLLTLAIIGLSALMPAVGGGARRRGGAAHHGRHPGSGGLPHPEARHPPGSDRGHRIHPEGHQRHQGHGKARRVMNDDHRQREDRGRQGPPRSGRHARRHRGQVQRAQAHAASSSTRPRSRTRRTRCRGSSAAPPWRSSPSAWSPGRSSAETTDDLSIRDCLALGGG